MKPQSRIALVNLLLALMLGLVMSAPAFAQQAAFAQPKLVVNTSFLNVRTGPGAQYAVLVTVVGGTELPVLGTAADNVWYYVSTEVGPGWVNIDYTLPRGDFTHVGLVDAQSAVQPPAVGVGVPSRAGSGYVTGVSLVGKDMFAQPNYDSMHIATSVPNDPLTIYPLLDQRNVSGTTWYLVSVPGVGTGWMDDVDIRILDCGPETVGVTTGETPIRFEGIANRDSYLLPGDVEGLLLGFGGVNNVYYRFQMPDGTLGLVDVNAVAPRSSAVVSVCDNLPAIVNANSSLAALGQGGGSVPTPILAPNRAIINTGFLNIRTGPSAGYAIVATVPGGTELAVIGRASDDVWMLVEGVFGRGWLNNEFVLFRGDYSTVPVINDAVIITNPAANLGQGGGGATITSGQQVTGVSLVGKDLFAQPNYGSMHVNTSVPNDPSTIYPLLGQRTVDGTTWYYVNINGIGAGWMDAVELRLLECGTDEVGITVGEHPIRFDGIANRDSFLLPNGTEGYIVGRRGDFTIFELQDGTVGLVLAEVIVPREGVTSVCTGVSSQAGSDSDSSSGADLPATGNQVIVNTGFLNIRSGPNAGFAVVATAPGGTELSVVGRTADGIWYFVEGAFGRGWLNNQFVLFRGDYTTVPIITFD